MPTKKISSKLLLKRIPLLLWLLPAIMLLALLAFSTYYRADKFNTEYSNTSDKCMAYQKLYNKKQFGCSYPIIVYSADEGVYSDTLRLSQEIECKIIYYGYFASGQVKAFIVGKSDFPSMLDTRLNFQKYYKDNIITEEGLTELTKINDSVYTSEIKFYKHVNHGEVGPYLKTGKRHPQYGDLYRPKYDSIYYAVSYLYYKNWIYCINVPGVDTAAIKKKVADIRDSFDFSETHLKETTFSPAESTAIVSVTSLLLLVCLLVGYRRVRSSFRSRKAKAVYFLHVLCLYALISVYLCLPDTCFTSWTRDSLTFVLFACLGIGILISAYRVTFSRLQE